MKSTNDVPLSDESKTVLQQAEHQARLLNHDFAGTEHLLLALAAGDSDAARVLQSLNVTADRLRNEIAALVTPGAAPITLETIPLTPRAAAAVDYAAGHARSLAQPLVEPGHLLVGLLHEPEGVAGRVMRTLCLDLRAVEERVLHIRLSQMRLVEKVVRPLRASVHHKRKLREELLAHLTTIYNEELTPHRAPAAALKSAADRFGDPDSLSHEFQHDAGLFQRIAFRADRILGWRSHESAARYALRLAAMMLAFDAACTILVVAIIARDAGYTPARFSDAAGIAAGFVTMMLLLPIDCFVLGILYYKTRDTLWGAFGAAKSRSRLAALQCAFAAVIFANYFVMFASEQSLNRVDLQEWSLALLGALTSIPVCLLIARTSGPTEIRDTIWACLTLEAAT